MWQSCSTGLVPSRGGVFPFRLHTLSFMRSHRLFMRHCRRHPVREADLSRPRCVSGLTLILIATAISGVAAYVVTWLVPHQIGLVGYATFAVFWSFLYFVIGSLTGIQQEVTRGTTAATAESSQHASRARNFGLVFGAAVFVVVVATAPLWVHAAFPADGWNLVWPFAFGTASFVMVAVLAGSFYGIAKWVPLALMISVDALLRLLGVSVVLSVTSSIVALAWAVAVPFPLTLVVLWPFIRNSVVGKTQLDVGYRAILWNVARTILAAASTGIMVSGLPFLLGLSSRGVPKATFGLVILATTLARAPLIVIAQSLQSYFIISFRDNVHHFWRTFLRLEALVAAAGIVLAALAWLIGPAVFGFLFPANARPDGMFLGALVLSSALVAALCIAAPAVLSRTAHFVYTLGWLAGASATILSLMLPLDFTTRTIIALFAGPIAGLAVHGGYLALESRRGRALHSVKNPSATA